MLEVTAVLVASIAAVVGSIIALLSEVSLRWLRPKSKQRVSIKITRDDGKQIKLSADKLNAESISKLLDAFSSFTAEAEDTTSNSPSGQVTNGSNPGVPQ